MKMQKKNLFLPPLAAQGGGKASDRKASGFILFHKEKGNDINNNRSVILFNSHSSNWCFQKSADVRGGKMADN